MTRGPPAHEEHAAHAIDSTHDLHPNPRAIDIRHAGRHAGHTAIRNRQQAAGALHVHAIRHLLVSFWAASSATNAVCSPKGNNPRVSKHAEALTFQQHGGGGGVGGSKGG